MEILKPTLHKAIEKHGRGGVFFAKAVTIGDQAYKYWD